MECSKQGLRCSVGLNPKFRINRAGRRGQVDRVLDSGDRCRRVQSRPRRSGSWL